MERCLTVRVYDLCVSVVAIVASSAIKLVQMNTKEIDNIQQEKPLQMQRKNFTMFAKRKNGEKNTALNYS